MKVTKQFRDFCAGKWMRRSLVAFWAVYFVTYLLLTLHGDYYGPYVAGKTRLKNSGWALRDSYILEPYHARFDRSGFNWAGAIFSPMILLDRLVCHRDKYIAFDHEP